MPVLLPGAAAPGAADAEGVGVGDASAGAVSPGAGSGVCGSAGAGVAEDSVDGCAAASESGVGSNETQPAPRMYSSGHECSCRLVTVYSPSSVCCGFAR